MANNNDGGKGKWANRLAKLGKHVKKASKAAKELGTGVEIDDGPYIAKLTGYELGESQAGRFQLTTKWSIIKGEFKGKEKWRFDGLEDEQNLIYVLSYLASLGVEDALESDFDPTLIESIMKKLAKAGLVARIKLRTKGEFQNLYVTKLLDADDIEEDGDEDGDDDDDSADDSADEDEDEDEDEDADEDSDDGDEDDEEVSTPEKGDSVEWGKGKKAKSGTIKNIKGDTATVQNEEGEKYEVDLSDLTVVTADDEDEDEDADGDEDEDTDSDKDDEDGDDEDEDGDDEDGGDDDDDEDEDDEPSDPEKGDTVSFKNKKGKKLSGEVKKVNAKKKTVSVEVDGVDGLVELAMDKVEVVAEEDDEDEDD